jgi:D-amino-acid oxidase
MHIVVVGAGVIGLSCAHRLVDAGHTVEIWSRDPPGAGVSAVAAAHWYPYRAFPEQAVARWSRATFTVLAELAGRPGTGIGLRSGRELSRTPLPDESGATAVPGARRLRADELPPGYADAYRLTVPTVRMPDYLSWLAGGLKAAGVPLRTRELADLSPARRAADLVVNATGLGARELLGDRRLTPVRGQVVRVACPGLDEWTLDEGHPDGMVYVIPRGPDVICGGTAEEGAEDTTPDPATAAAILARCRSVVPELAAAEVLGHAVGLRPVRDAVRLEREGDVVHCYGHGGSGVTVSWGCADEVARLVAGTDSPAEHRSA